VPGVHVVWHIPPRRTPDHYALEVLAEVLGGGESSRFTARS
jgi:predicted Zn-dependent peptidase